MFFNCFCRQGDLLNFLYIPVSFTICCIDPWFHATRCFQMQNWLKIFRWKNKKFKSIWPYYAPRPNEGNIFLPLQRKPCNRQKINFVSICRRQFSLTYSVMGWKKKVWMSNVCVCVCLGLFGPFSLYSLFFFFFNFWFF